MIVCEQMTHTQSAPCSLGPVSKPSPEQLRQSGPLELGIVDLHSHVHHLHLGVVAFEAAPPVEIPICRA